jgi:ATP-dependent Clp protease ATP-binding subunit ClpA
MAAVLKSSIGDQLDKLGAERAKIEAVRKKHQDLADEAEAAIADIDKQVLDLMDEAKTTDTAGQKFGFKIELSEVPRATSWDEFYKYIHKHRAYHLLERRPASRNSPSAK